ncbi:MAG: hypothetical protein Q4G62_00625 [Pseudomonadota bacterium]|nr:hypothetical protein [Pseudomonadota bacterium]
MARFRPRRALRWPLDYGWGQRHWRWNDAHDVLLEAQPWTHTPDAVRAAVHAWLASKQADQAEVDGKLQPIVYEGGIWMQCHDRRGGQPALCIDLHSSGQDAFDAIKWYADELVDVLLAADPAIKVKWIKHPHQRHYRRPTGR